MPLAVPVQASAAPEGFNLWPRTSLFGDIHPGTAEIAIEEIASHTCGSPILSIGGQERIARGQTKDQLSAQFTISTTPGWEQRLMDSYNEASDTDNTRSFRWTMDPSPLRPWETLERYGLPPVMIRADRFESLILERIDSSRTGSSLGIATISLRSSRWALTTNLCLICMG